jgi:hypothetical protein
LLVNRRTRVAVFVVSVAIVAAACGTDATPTDDAPGVNAAASDTTDDSSVPSSTSPAGSPTAAPTSETTATAAESSTENSSAEEPPAEEPPADEPAAEDPPADDPPPDDPPADTRAPALSEVIVEPGDIFGGECSTEASVYASVKNETGVEASLTYAYLPTSMYGGFTGVVPVSVETGSSGIQLIGHVKNLPNPYPSSGVAQAALVEFRWTVTDAAGNTSKATATADVGECEAVDTQAPVLSDLIVEPSKIFGGTCATQASVYAFVKNETNVNANLSYRYLPEPAEGGIAGSIPVTTESSGNGLQLIGHVSNLPDAQVPGTDNWFTSIVFRWGVQDVAGNISEEKTVTASLGRCP